MSMNLRNKIMCCLAALSSFGTHQVKAYKPTYVKLQESGMIRQLKEKNIQKKFIETSAGRIAYYETSGSSGPLVLIHGNSCSKEYMIKQLDDLGLKYKMIAIDLPGHGESSNALNPSENYTLTGYAQVISEVIQKLNLGPVVLVGWSLGGHIAFEMMAKNPELLQGVLIASAPPFTPSEQGIKEAYLPTYSTPLGMKLEPFTLEDVKAYITQGGIDLDRYPFLIEASMRAHGLARFTMVSAVLRREGVDERKVAETSPVSLGIIMGAKEHAVNNEYIKSLKYANCLMMETLEGGHDCHWSHAKQFNQLVDQFVQQISQSTN